MPFFNDDVTKPELPGDGPVTDPHDWKENRHRPYRMEMIALISRETWVYSDRKSLLGRIESLVKQPDKLFALGAREHDDGGLEFYAIYDEELTK